MFVKTQIIHTCHLLYMYYMYYMYVMCKFCLFFKWPTNWNFQVLSYNCLVSGNTKHYYSSIVYKTEKILSKKCFYILFLPVPSFKFMKNVFIRTRCSKPENLLLMTFWKVANLVKNLSPAVILFHISEYVTETHSQNCRPPIH